MKRMCCVQANLFGDMPCPTTFLQDRHSSRRGHRLQLLELSVFRITDYQE